MSDVNGAVRNLLNKDENLAVWFTLLCESGPDASLSESEVVTLAIFARWSRFTSERDFYRYASSSLSDAFLALPTARSSTGWCATTWASSRK
jgi:hypothetical protein